MAWAKQQSATVNGSGSANDNTDSLTLGNNVTAGNRLIAVLSAQAVGASAAFSVSDSAGNTWTEDVTHVFTTSIMRCSIWSAPITAGGGSKPTVTFSSATNIYGISATLLEVSGLSNVSGAGALDGTAGNDGGNTQSTSPTTGTTAATTAANELTVCGYGDYGWNTTITAASLTIDGNDSPNSATTVVMGHRDSGSSATTQSCTFTSTAPGTTYSAVVAVYKLSSAAKQTIWPLTTPNGSTTADPSVTNGFGSFGANAWPTTHWRPLADNAWNNALLPVNPTVLGNSAAMVTRMFSIWDGLPVYVLQGPDTTSDFERPVYWSQPSDPWFVPSSGGNGNADGIKLQIPQAAKRAGGGDGHMIVIDQVTGIERDFWQVVPNPLPTGGTFASPTSFACSWASTVSVLGDGTMTSGAGSDAANTALSAGPVRAPELVAGVIPHAIEMLTGNTAASSVFPASGLAHTDPTTDTAGVATSGSTTYTTTNSANKPFLLSDNGLTITGTFIQAGTTITYVSASQITLSKTATGTGASTWTIANRNLNYPPDGQLFKLTYTAAQIAALPIHAWLKAVLTACATYGMYVRDTGGRSHPIELLFESGSTYTSFAASDPIMTYAAAHEADTNSGISHSSSPLVYFFDIMTGVDWAGHLQALAPPPSVGSPPPTNISPATVGQPSRVTLSGALNGGVAPAAPSVVQKLVVVAAVVTATVPAMGVVPAPTIVRGLPPFPSVTSLLAEVAGGLCTAAVVFDASTNAAVALIGGNESANTMYVTATHADGSVYLNTPIPPNTVTKVLYLFSDGTPLDVTSPSASGIHWTLTNQPTGTSVVTTPPISPSPAPVTQVVQVASPFPITGAVFGPVVTDLLQGLRFAAFPIGAVAPSTVTIKRISRIVPLTFPVGAVASAPVSVSQPATGGTVAASFLVPFKPWDAAHPNGALAGSLWYRPVARAIDGTGQVNGVAAFYGRGDGSTSSPNITAPNATCQANFGGKAVSSDYEYIIQGVGNGVANDLWSNPGWPSKNFGGFDTGKPMKVDGSLFIQAAQHAGQGIQDLGVSAINQAGAYLHTDGSTVYNFNAFCIDPAGSRPYASTVYADNTLTSRGTFGGRGASALSAYGGALRPGELESATKPIAHAIKATAPMAWWARADQGFHGRGNDGNFAGSAWPAQSSDSNSAQTGNGNAYYGASFPSGAAGVFWIGSLLAIKPTDLAAAKAACGTVAGKNLAQCLSDYGMYIVENSSTPWGDGPAAVGGNQTWQVWAIDVDYAATTTINTINTAGFNSDFCALLPYLFVVMNNYPEV